MVFKPAHEIDEIDPKDGADSLELDEVQPSLTRFVLADKGLGTSQPERHLLLRQTSLMPESLQQAYEPVLLS